MTPSEIRIHYTFVISVVPRFREIYERTSPPKRKDIAERYFKRGRYDTFFSEKRRKQLILSREANARLKHSYERLPYHIKARYEELAAERLIDRIHDYIFQ